MKTGSQTSREEGLRTPLSRENIVGWVSLKLPWRPQLTPSEDINSATFISLLRQMSLGGHPINGSLLTKPTTAKKILHLFQNLSLMDKEVETLITT